jgi:hypothetical protein
MQLSWSYRTSVSFSPRFRMNGMARSHVPGHQNAHSRDIIYIDDLADPDVWHDGDEDGPVDVNGYPPEIESGTSKERV